MAWQCHTAAMMAGAAMVAVLALKEATGGNEPHTQIRPTFDACPFVLEACKLGVHFERRVGENLEES